MSLSPVEFRRVLHRRPEPSFAEFATSALIEENIALASAETGTAVRVHKPLATGLIVEYSGAEPSEPYTLLRADIDALKMDEDSGCDYMSANGYMHACGHDVHSAILYGFILEVLASKIKKNFIFLFQPAEETGGGAELIIKSGILDNFNISSACSLHVTDEFEEGTVASAPGVLFASAREVDIEFIGKASHIAFPERGLNAVNAARSFLDEVDRMIESRGGGLIFGIGKFGGGEVRNILPAHAKIEGSIRALSTVLSDGFYDEMTAALEKVKLSTGVDFTIKTGSYYPEVSVDESFFRAACAKLSLRHKFINCGHKLTGEDFGFISRRYPSFMFWLGTARPDRESAGLHNPRFFPPESVIGRGIEIFKDLFIKELMK